MAGPVGTNLIGYNITYYSNSVTFSVSIGASTVLTNQNNGLGFIWVPSQNPITSVDSCFGLILQDGQGNILDKIGVGCSIVVPIVNGNPNATQLAPQAPLTNTNTSTQRQGSGLVGSDFTFANGIAFTHVYSLTTTATLAAGTINTGQTAAATQSEVLQYNLNLFQPGGNTFYLPSSATLGQIVIFKADASVSSTSPVCIYGQNGIPIQGGSPAITISSPYDWAIFVYAPTTNGTFWTVLSDENNFPIITNANVAPNAGIVYSKLNLGSSIQISDLSPAAYNISAIPLTLVERDSGGGGSFTTVYGKTIQLTNSLVPSYSTTIDYTSMVLTDGTFTTTIDTGSVTSTTIDGTNVNVVNTLRVLGAGSQQTLVTGTTVTAIYVVSTGGINTVNLTSTGPIIANTINASGLIYSNGGIYSIAPITATSTILSTTGINIGPNVTNTGVQMTPNYIEFWQNVVQGTSLYYGNISTGVVTATSGIITGTLNASGLITANGGISVANITNTGSITTSSLTVNGQITTQTLTASGLITANGGISSANITNSGSIATASETVSGQLTASILVATAVMNATTSYISGAIYATQMTPIHFTCINTAFSATDSVTIIPTQILVSSFTSNTTITPTLITTGIIAASGLISANGGINTANLTSSGLITANGGITASSETITGLLTANALTVAGLITGNGGVYTVNITCLGLITASQVNANTFEAVSGGSSAAMAPNEIDVQDSFGHLTTISGTLISTLAINTAGLINSNGGIITTNLTSSGLITANGGITTTTETLTGLLTATKITASDLITANGGITTANLTSSGPITANGGITTTTETVTGLLTTGAITASGLITGNGGISTTNVTSSGTITSATSVVVGTTTFTGVQVTTSQVQFYQSGSSGTQILWSSMLTNSVTAETQCLVGSSSNGITQTPSQLQFTLSTVAGTTLTQNNVTSTYITATNTLTAATSIVTGTESVTGALYANGGIYLPTSGGTPALFNYFETFTDSTTNGWSGKQKKHELTHSLTHSK